MPTNQQRRETERRRLQRQLEERRTREAARKRFTLIGSIIGTLVVVAAIVVIVVVSTGGSSKKKAGGEKASDDTVANPSTSTSAPAPTSSAPAVALPTQPCAAPQKGTTATYAGLKVTGATDLKHEPKVTGKAPGADPATVTCADLVIGKGAAATSSSSVTVQYVGLVYKTGTIFQSSWGMGAVQPFSLNGGVIDGFAQGIGGAGKIAPMHVGGRRIIIMPGNAAYGASPPQGSNIPANASLVFVVDLQKES